VAISLLNSASLDLGDLSAHARHAATASYETFPIRSTISIEIPHCLQFPRLQA
jgi:hypothetical protein